MSKPNIKRVIEEILSNEKNLIEFFSCENQDELYNYCMSKEAGYTREEFDEFIEETIKKSNKEIPLNEADGGAKVSHCAISKKVRRAFTKVLAAGLAVLSVAPVAQNFVPQIRAAKISEITSKENSKRNRKNNDKTTVKNNTVVEDNDYINQKKNMPEFIKAVRSTKKFRINSNLIKLAALSMVAVGTGVLLINGIDPSAYMRQGRIANVPTPPPPQNTNTQNSTITVHVSFSTGEGYELLHEGREQVDLNLNTNSEVLLHRIIANNLNWGNSTLSTILTHDNRDVSSSYLADSQIQGGDSIKVVLFDHDPEVFSYRNQEDNPQQRLQIETERYNEIARQIEETQHRQQEFECSVTVNVKFLTPNNKQLVYCNNGETQLELKLDANNIEQPINQTIAERFDLNVGDVREVVLSRTYETITDSRPSNLIQNNDSILVIIDHHEYPEIFYSEWESEITQQRQQRNLETEDQKEARKKARNESRRNKEIEEREKFEDKKKMGEDRIVKKDSAEVEEDLAKAKSCLTKLVTLRDSNPSLAELSNKIVFEYCRSTCCYVSNFTDAYARLSDFIEFFEQIKNIEISNLAKFKIEKFTFYLALRRLIEKCPHEEIILFCNSLYMFIHVVESKINKNSPISDLKFNLASLQRVSKDFNRIKKDELLIGFSAPIIEAVDKIIEELNTILQDRTEKDTGIVTEYAITGGIPLKRYIYNLTDNKEILRLCIKFVEGAIEQSNSGIYLGIKCEVFVGQDGSLKYTSCRNPRPLKEVKALNFDNVKNRVFEILRSNLPKVFYKELIEKMEYTLKIKEKRYSPTFYDIQAEGVIYAPHDVVEVSSDLEKLLSKLEEPQSEYDDISNRSGLSEVQ